MSEKPTNYAEGGVIPSPPGAALPTEFRNLHPDECVIGPKRPHVCLRPDHAHRHGAPRQENT